MPGVGDRGLQLAVVGEGEQPLAVGVEPAGGIHARDGHELLERAVSALGRELADDPVRFVQEQKSAQMGKSSPTPKL